MKLQLNQNIHDDYQYPNEKVNICLRNKFFFLKKKSFLDGHSHITNAKPGVRCHKTISQTNKQKFYVERRMYQWDVVRYGYCSWQLNKPLK